MNTINKIFFFLLCGLFLNLCGYSQTLFVDDFSYAPRDSLQGLGGWYLSGVYAPYRVAVVSPGLTYTGYAGSGIGNTAFIYNQGSGEIVLHNFTAQTSGSLYMAFMMRLDSVGASTTQGYNIGFDLAGGATQLNTRTCIRRVSSNSYNIGIAKLSSPVYKNAVYSTNATYLIVVKYIFVAGAGNDSAKIFIFSSGVPATEPPAADTFDVSGSDAVDNGEVFLSNSYAQGTALSGTTVRYDGIRIGTTWQGAVLTSIKPISTEIPEHYSLYQNYPNPFNPSTKIRFDIGEFPLIKGGGAERRGLSVSLKIFDILGREAALLVNEQLSPGSYEVEWNAVNHPSGVYYYRLTAGEFSVSKKMTLVK